MCPCPPQLYAIMCPPCIQLAASHPAAFQMCPCPPQLDAPSPEGCSAPLAMSRSAHHRTPPLAPPLARVSALSSGPGDKGAKVQSLLGGPTAACPPLSEGKSNTWPAAPGLAVPPGAPSPWGSSQPWQPPERGQAPPWHPPPPRGLSSTLAHPALLWAPSSGLTASTTPPGQFCTLTAPCLAGAALRHNLPHTAGPVLYHDPPLHAEAGAVPHQHPHGLLQACSHLGNTTPCSENHETPHLPFFRTTSSDSGLRLTETTFITRWFPPCRIKDTTCLCPTFTTLTPFT